MSARIEALSMEIEMRARKTHVLQLCWKRWLIRHSALRSLLI